MNKFTTIDYVIFVVYFIIVSSYGYWVYSRKKIKGVSDSKDFFLAEGSLTWWAIGASLIASNISAEQFIGASGTGLRRRFGCGRLRMGSCYSAYYCCRMVCAGVS
jgi:SSS family solute:Na+ symporter